MILLVSSIFPPEPVVSANLTKDLAVALTDKWKVRVITPRPSRPLGFLFNENTIENAKYERIVLNSFIYPESKFPGRMRESYSFGRHAADYIRKNKIDIQCIYVNAWPLLAQYLIVKASRKYSIRTVLHVQDIYPESMLGKLPLLKNFFLRLLLPIDKYVLKNTHRVVTISPMMKKLLIEKRGIDERKVDVIYNWQNEDLFLDYKKTAKTENKRSSFTFMFLGSLSKTAAVHDVISAFKMSCLGNSRLVIAGNGAEKDFLISMANKQEGLNIEFWDAPMAKVPEIQDKADVLILSLKKGAAQFALPSKLPAYMFSEKPIIACAEEESDTAKAIIKANCGWVIVPEDIVALSEAMIAVKALPEDELLKYGKNGFDYALENYSKKNNLNKIVTLINESVIM
jgi:glycosyltransferase involved in cell wall biosynthesis